MADRIRQRMTRLPQPVWWVLLSSMIMAIFAMQWRVMVRMGDVERDGAVMRAAHETFVTTAALGELKTKVAVLDNSVEDLAEDVKMLGRVHGGGWRRHLTPPYLEDSMSQENE